MSPKTSKIVISGPFDARHVGGVSIPGVTIPVVGIQRSFTSLEPDTVPTHSFAATGTSEITKPKRSNSLASSLSRPLHLLRTRSASNSPDRKREPNSVKEENNTEEGDMSTASLRKKPSMSRLRERARSNPADRLLRQRSIERNIPETTVEHPVSKPTAKALPSLRLRESESNIQIKTTLVDLPDHSHRHQQPQPQRPRQPPQPPQPPQQTLQKQASTRLKRADSGTAINFNDQPVEERPLGFREIIAVNSFEQRMALYKKTREYWATTDHGLEEWVGKAVTRRPLVAYA